MLKIKKAHLKDIVSNCKKDFPNESCGILAGKDNTVQKVYPMTNTQKSPKTYLMEPKEQLMVMKQMRRDNLDMLAIYHSHTASEPYPSKTDVEMAFYQDVSYVIVSLADQDNPKTRSFQLADGKIIEETLEII